MRAASGDHDSPGVMSHVPTQGDFEEVLRLALQDAADGVEAKGDGLTRIFRRLAAPWLVRQASLLATDCVDLFELITIWVQPIAARALSAVAAAARSARVAFQRRTSPAWLRTAVAWLRPALAAGITAAIVMTGTVALSQTVARLELSGNRPAAIPAVAGTAPTTGGHRPPASGTSGPGDTQITPAGETPPAGPGGATHHSCAATRCSSGRAGAPAPGASMQPTTSPSGNATATPQPKKHHHPHQPQGHQHQHVPLHQHGPRHQHHHPHQPHQPHSGSVGAAGH
jgi:hypothetical protein